MHKFAIISPTSLSISKFFLGALIIGLSLFLFGCLEEDTFSPPSEELSSSRDTIRFDTVFTSVGSATRSVRLLNNSNENISIASIRFENNTLSKFRMNVDGLPGEEFFDVEIRANDSLYIFVEVTIDPDQPRSISPFIIEDAIIIEGGNISQKVHLEAWGQNANYIPQRNNQGILSRLTCNNGNVTWDDPRPYVIYGILFVDSCHLTLPPNTELYFHGGLANFNGFITNDGGLIFQKDGRLTANGSLDQPVTFQGDRLEESFQDVSGQWRGITFLPQSGPHLLTHTQIKNSVIGISADSLAEVFIDKSIVSNSSRIGVLGSHSNISLANSLIHSNGASSLSFLYGGNYDVSYTTLANYGNQSSALELTNFRVIDPNQNLVDILPLNASIRNSIILGNDEDEILYVDALENTDPEMFNILIQNSLIKADELQNEEYFTSICDNCVWSMNGDSTFVDRSEMNFNLHPLSPARGIANPIQGINDDINGISREMTTPDAGCFEGL